MSITRFTIDDPAPATDSEARDLFVVDMIDERHSDSMSVGFARYVRGEWHDWQATHDEVLIVTKGQFALKSSDGVKSARAGEILFITRGTQLLYRAIDDTELVYVTYPHWADASRRAEDAVQLGAFHRQGLPS
jgi:ethanolamine utilization protein EutQ